jgi:hypothetical protein
VCRGCMESSEPITSFDFERGGAERDLVRHLRDKPLPRPSSYHGDSDGPMHGDQYAAERQTIYQMTDEFEATRR